MAPTTCEETESLDSYVEGMLSFNLSVSEPTLTFFSSDAQHFGETLIFNDSQLIECAALLACASSSITFSETVSECLLWCSTDFACFSASMDFSQCATAKLICDGYRACDSLSVTVESGTNERLEIECGASQSCTALRIDILGDADDEGVLFGESVVTCFEQNACDELEVRVPAGTEELHRLEIHGHSNDIKLRNGFGLRSHSDNDSAPFIECIDDDMLFPWNYTFASLSEPQRIACLELELSQLEKSCDGVVIDRMSGRHAL